MQLSLLIGSVKDKANELSSGVTRDMTGSTELKLTLSN